MPRRAAPFGSWSIAAPASVLTRSSRLETLALTPDGTTVYYTDVSRRGVHRVMKIGVGGGDPEMVVQGAAPSISPDGSRLAFSFFNGDSETANHNAIGILDLATGTRTDYVLDEDEKDFFQVNGHIYATSWSPDASEIVYYFEYEGPELPRPRSREYISVGKHHVEGIELAVVVRNR